MRFRLTARVEAVARATRPFSVVAGELRAGVATTDSGEVAEIWVELPVRDCGTFLPAVSRPPGEPMHIDFREPPEANELLAILQYVESMGGFWLNITRLHWSEAKHEWIPESPEEQMQLPVLAMSWKKNYQRSPIEFQGDILQDIFARRSEKEWLTVPLSFYREGRNDYLAHRYINAFYSFYFLLEDLFGDGNTKNRLVLQAFRVSDELKTAVAHAYRQRAMAGKDVQVGLQTLIRRVGGDETPEGLLEFLVAVRGELHHYSRKSSRPKGHPLNQQEFRPVAWLAMAICLALLPDVLTKATDGSVSDVRAV